MSDESPDDKFARVRLMADGDSQWDLSDNDMAALRYLLDTNCALTVERDALATALRELLFAFQLEGAWLWLQDHQPKVYAALQSSAVNHALPHEDAT